MNTLRILPLQPQHTAQILLIQDDCFLGGWTADQFSDFLAERAMPGVSYRGKPGVIVAAAGNRVLGYMVLDQFKNRLHIVAVGVDEAKRGRGVGRALVGHARECWLTTPDRWITAEVFAGQTDALEFFQAMKFNCKLTRDNRHWLEAWPRKYERQNTGVMSRAAGGET